LLLLNRIAALRPADLLIAVITPFLDRRHGTERCVIEQLERLSADDEIEIHIYAQWIQDLPAVARYKPGAPQSETRLWWHKVPAIPGPHLLQYIFWFFANGVCRWWDGKFRHLKYDLTYSPGINARDADAIAVHIVFHAFYRQVISELSFRRTPVGNWPRLIHRRCYYRLIMALEDRVYKRPNVSLAAVSGLVAQQLAEYFQRKDVRVIRNGVDTESFSLSRRLARRASARKELGLAPADFTLLLIGNDWKKKGLDGLLQALSLIASLPWKLLVVGSDARDPYEKIIRDRNVLDRVFFLTPSPDVMQFYAAADAYVGPSLEDAYGLPILEAMACGLPVIASSQAGASEIVRDGTNGIFLHDPRDIRELSTKLRALLDDSGLCTRLGEEASRTAQQHTWGKNAQATREWLETVFRSSHR
jgi:glycosyltransferase involved in cell wall biosynthesis